MVGGRLHACGTVASAVGQGGRGPHPTHRAPRCLPLPSPSSRCQAYPRGQLLVLRTEEFQADEGGQLLRVLRFLGLPPPPDAGALAAAAAGGARANRGYRANPKVPG